MRLCCPKDPQAFKTRWLFLAVALMVTILGGSVAAEAAETIILAPQTVAPGEAALTVNLEMPAGYKLNQEAPSTLGLKSDDPKIVALDDKNAQNLPVAKLPLSLKVPVNVGRTTLHTTFRLNFCDDKLGVCFLKEVVIKMPVEVVKTSNNNQLQVHYTVKPN